MDLSGHIKWSEDFGREKNRSPFRDPNDDRPAGTLSTIMTKLSGLLLYGVL